MMIDETAPTILVIDDEPALAELMKSFLSDSGYCAYSFTRPTDALAWYKNHFNSVDAIFLDLKMPEMDGKACFIKILEFNPNQKVALMSGFSEEKIVQELMEKGALIFFEKPFDIKELLSWLAQLTQCRAKSLRLNV